MHNPKKDTLYYNSTGLTKLFIYYIIPVNDSRMLASAEKDSLCDGPCPDQLNLDRT